VTNSMRKQIYNESDPWIDICLARCEPVVLRVTTQLMLVVLRAVSISVRKTILDAVSPTNDQNP
jgi:hypothetical protein